MICDNPQSHFIFIYHPDVVKGKRKYTLYQGREMTNGEVLKYWGKWLVLGEKQFIDGLAVKLDPYVENEQIPCIKYDRNPSANLGIKEIVLMVYCDRRNRDKVWDILKTFGIKLKAWVTEMETMALWMPGGILMERWLTTQNFAKSLEDEIRNDARMRLSYIHNNPDEIFTSWVQ